MISNEKSAIISVLNEKILFYKEIISKTYLCYKHFLTNSIFKTFEITPAFTELEYIQLLINNLENNIQDEEKIIDELLNNLQEINDKLSLTIKQFGTDSINDLLNVCLGNEYIQENILHNSNTISFYNFLNEYSNVTNYEIVSTSFYSNDTANTKNIKIKNIDQDNATFYMKIFGYQLIIVNIESNQTIMINCIFKDIPPSYIHNSILNEKILNIKNCKPNNMHFESPIFNNFIESLSIKGLMVTKVENIYEMYIGSITHSASIIDMSLIQV